MLQSKKCERRQIHSGLPESESAGVDSGMSNGTVTLSAEPNQYDPQAQAPFDFRASHLPSYIPAQDGIIAASITWVDDSISPPLVQQFPSPTPPRKICEPEEDSVPVDNLLGRGEVKNIATEDEVEIINMQSSESKHPATSTMSLKRKASPSVAEVETESKKARIEATGGCVGKLHILETIREQGWTQWLDDEAVLGLLKGFMGALLPMSIAIADPVTVRAKEPRKPINYRSDRASTILVPLMEDHHWVLGVWRPTSSSTCVVYDSARLPGLDRIRDAVAIRLRSYLEKVVGNCVDVVPETSAVQQENGSDCGVAVVVHALYVVAGRELPQRTDFRLWRGVFANFTALLCTADSDARYQCDIVDWAYSTVKSAGEVDLPAPHQLGLSDTAARGSAKQLIDFYRSARHWAEAEGSKLANRVEGLRRHLTHFREIEGLLSALIEKTQCGAKAGISEMHDFQDEIRSQWMAIGSLEQCRMTNQKALSQLRKPLRFLESMLIAGREAKSAFDFLVEKIENVNRVLWQGIEELEGCEDLKYG